MLEALVCGLVPGAAGEILGQARHVGDLFFEIVGVFVAGAVADVFHEIGGCVAEMERNRTGFSFVNVFEDIAVSSVNGVGFWGEA